MPTQRLLFIMITAVATLGAVPHLVYADKLDGFDDTMQVFDSAEALEKTAANLKVPKTDPSDEGADSAQEAAANEITDPADFDDDFEHDVELEEELMQDEDDFEDGDDVDDDRIGASKSTIR